MVTDLCLRNQGLQTQICVCFLLFQCDSAVTGSGRAKPEQVLFKIFSGHKEGQWFTADIRSVCSEQALVYKFRMLTHKVLIHCAPRRLVHNHRSKGCLFSHPHLPLHRKYLRFAFQGITYEYQVHLFGFSLSMRVFLKCTKPGKGGNAFGNVHTVYCRRLLAAQSPQQPLALTRLLSSHLVALGFTLNWEKSVLIPTQTIRFIGLSLHSLAFRACLSVETARTVIPLGCLQMRPFQ